MSDSFETAMARLRPLPPGLAVEAARADQQRRASAGRPIPAERYLASLPAVVASIDDALVLVYGEIQYREAAGATADMAEYSRRFPEYATRLAELFELHGLMAGLTEMPVVPVRPKLVPPSLPGYRDLSFVARGGMGDVFRGRLESTGADVAIKVVSTSGEDDSVRLVRFIQEGEMLARLDHPNIVRFVTAGAHARRPYLVTEWIDGGTLEQKMGKPWSTERAVELFLQLAAAVEYAHEHGVIHRDLKPANVLLAANGQPKLTDFGVARWTRCGRTLTGTGEVLGTVCYMAAEQLRGNPSEVGPAVDVYGLAAILYELLAGRPPFSRRKPMEVIPKVLHDAPTRPEQFVSSIPAALADLCMSGLAKDATARPASPRDMARIARAASTRPMPSSSAG